MDRRVRSDLHQRRSRITRRLGSTEASRWGRPVAVVRAALERRVGPARSEDHHRHGRSALPDATDERQAVVGASAGLQRDPIAHGAGRQQRRRGSAQSELQAHRATVDAVGGLRTVPYARQWTAVRADRAMPSGSSPRANRAANAKTKTQTLSLAQDAEGSRSQAGSAARACVGDKVSAIRVRRHSRACSLGGGDQASGVRPADTTAMMRRAFGQAKAPLRTRLVDERQWRLQQHTNQALLS